MALAVNVFQYEVVGWPCTTWRGKPIWCRYALPALRCSAARVKSLDHLWKMSGKLARLDSAAIQFYKRAKTLLSREWRQKKVCRPIRDAVISRHVTSPFSWRSLCKSQHELQNMDVVQCTKYRITRPARLPTHLHSTWSRALGFQ
jgi:hypothetical protein